MQVRKAGILIYRLVKRLSMDDLRRMTLDESLLIDKLLIEKSRLITLDDGSQCVTANK